METIVNNSTFLSTWSSISLSLGLALIDLLVKNKLLNKEGLSTATFSKFAHIFGRSKIIFDTNMCTFCGFVRVIDFEL